MLRVMVVDDEPPAPARAETSDPAHPDVEVIGEAGSLDQAQQLTHALRPDAIFLDIDLGDDNGFGLIKRLDQVPAIVFVTDTAPSAAGVRCRSAGFPAETRRAATPGIDPGRLRRYRRALDLDSKIEDTQQRR